jgi:leucyl aminopeptidase
MKQIINVEVKARKAEPVELKTDMLAVGHFSDAKGLDKLNRELDRRLGGAVRRVIDLGDFRGKEGTCAVIYGGPPTAASRVLLVGLGEKRKAGLDTIRKAAACAANKAVALKVGQLGLALHKSVGGRFRPEAMGRAIAEGVWFGGYRYDEFVTGDENGRPDSLKAQLIDPDARKIRSLGKGVSRGAIIGRAQSYARTLANRPANVINPAVLAAAATKLTREAKNLTCTVFDEKQMAAKGMGGVLAVGSGSKNKPRFIIIKYSPGRKPPKNRPTVALVGKAITFDSGGLSIKPAPGMQEMKLDKTGGVVVLGAMMAAAQLQLAVNVLGIIPAAENLPSGTSYRPGDIVTTFSGKTVEVQNTDAEGRMILCDALGYAVKQNCDVLIDIATLTGACRVALGNYMAGLMSNDDKLSKQLQQASEESGEKVWPMPSGDEYAEEMKSKIADLKNIGGKFGGACTAAAFLRQFVADKKWAHLDIAGVEAFEKATAFTAEGSSGFGVRLLVTYLMSLCG